jgi:hypothetical protein
MYKTKNLHLTAFLLTASKKAKILNVEEDNGKAKIFVLSGSESDYMPLIMKFFGGEKINISPKDLFQQVKNLKSLIYDGYHFMDS